MPLVITPEICVWNLILAKSPLAISLQVLHKSEVLESSKAPQTTGQQTGLFPTAEGSPSTLPQCFLLVLLCGSVSASSDISLDRVPSPFSPAVALNIFCSYKSSGRARTFLLVPGVTSFHHPESLYFPDRYIHPAPPSVHTSVVSWSCKVSEKIKSVSFTVSNDSVCCLPSTALLLNKTPQKLYTSYQAKRECPPAPDQHPPSEALPGLRPLTLQGKLCPRTPKHSAL